MKKLLNLFKKNKKITDNAFDPLSDDAEMDPFLDLPDWELYDYVSTVMYIEDTYNPEINEFIRSNIRQLTAKYDKAQKYRINIRIIVDFILKKKRRDVLPFSPLFYSKSLTNPLTNSVIARG